MHNANMQTENFILEEVAVESNESRIPYNSEGLVLTGSYPFIVLGGSLTSFTRLSGELDKETVAYPLAEMCHAVHNSIVMHRHGSGAPLHLDEPRALAMRRNSHDVYHASAFILHFLI